MSNYQEFLNEAASVSDNAYYTAELTDRYLIGLWSQKEEIDTAKLLEIRVFDQKTEVKLFRRNIGEDFNCRTIVDKSDDPDRFDVLQLLDKDSQRSRETHYYTTGGGEYEFSFKELKCPAVRIRYYLQYYPETGQAYIADWRCVDFEEMKQEK